jgi:hypothetical protein
VPPTFVGQLVMNTKVELGWPSQPSQKRVYKGTVPAGSAWTGNETIVATVGQLTIRWTDLNVPAVGAYFYYDLRPFNGCGEGQ